MKCPLLAQSGHYNQSRERFWGKADMLRQYLVAVLAIAPAWMAAAAIFK
jgi:hypothetical protein